MKTDIMMAREHYPTENDNAPHSKWHDLIAQYELQFDNLNIQHKHQLEDLLKRQEWQRKNLFNKQMQTMTKFAELAFSELQGNS